MDDITNTPTGGFAVFPSTDAHNKTRRRIKTERSLLNVLTDMVVDLAEENGELKTKNRQLRSLNKPGALGEGSQNDEDPDEDPDAAAMEEQRREKLLLLKKLRDDLSQL